MQVYDWENNLINFTDCNGINFYIQLKGNKNIVTGKAGTGKTLMCTRLKELQADNVYVADAGNISEIVEVKDKLIVIDRADIILDKTMVKAVNNDSSNRYLIFARKPLGIEVTPNHFAEFQFDYDKRQVTINYLFDVKGWC